MTAYSLLLLAHLVLFAYWLGADVGVYYASYRVCDPALGVEARRTALRIMLWIDMIPRYCLVLILPVGIALATGSGALALDAAWLPAIGLAALAWLALVWAIHHHQQRPIASTLRRVDAGVRIAVIAGTLLGGALGLAGAGPVGARWLAAKLLLYGVIVGCGLMIRVAIQPFATAFVEIVQHGSTPERESRLAVAIGRARPFVLVIWAALVVLAYLGAVKPALGA